MEKMFTQVSGKVVSLTELENGEFRYSCQGENGEFTVAIPETTIIVDNIGEKAEMAVDCDFDAYIIGNKAMIAIYPPIYSPDFIVMKTEKVGFVKVDIFNESFVNESNDLLLNMHEDVVVENLAGERVDQEELVNELMAAFYWRTTFSIPAQTSPTKVILLK